MDGPLGPLIARIVKEGISAREGLRMAREQGFKIRDSTWFRMVSEAKKSLVVHADEASKSLSRRPRDVEITNLTTKVATGYMQYAEVYVRDKDSGLVSRRPYAVRSQTLFTRQQVLNVALANMTAETAAEGSFPNEVVLFAVYTATYAMTPAAE